MTLKLTPEQLDELARAYPALAPQLNELKLEASNSLRKRLGKTGASILAAFTTPDAVKAEKYLTVVALTRAAMLLPGAAVLIDLLIKALGGPSVTP